MRTYEPVPPPILRTGGPARRALHHLIALVAWVGFGWAWYLVFFRRTSTAALPGLLSLALFLLLVMAATAIWVRYNIALHRRKPPRTRVPVVEETWDHDALGRPLEADWTAVRAASRVHVRCEPERKIFAPESSP